MMHVKPMFKTMPERHREKSSINVAALSIITREEELTKFDAKIGVSRDIGKKRCLQEGSLQCPCCCFLSNTTWSCLVRSDCVAFEVKWVVSPQEAPQQQNWLQKPGFGCSASLPSSLYSHKYICISWVLVFSLFSPPLPSICYKAHCAKCQLI